MKGNEISGTGNSFDDNPQIYEIIKARHFRNELAKAINREYNIADDFRSGLTAIQIDKKHSISENLGVISGRNVYTAILMVLEGYKDLNGNYFPGQISDISEYKQITRANQITKGRSLEKRKKIGTHANNHKFKKRGLKPWTDDEKYIIWQFMYNGVKDSRGRVKRGQLVNILNNEYKNDRKDSHVRNIITYYRNIRKMSN